MDSVWCAVFFFSSRRRHTRCREVSWARRCVQETDTRGHTPFDVASDPEVKQFTSKAISVKNCMICDKKFDFIQVRHYCTKCQKYVCKNCCEKMIMDETIESLETVSYTHLTLPTILLVQISVVAVSLKKKQDIQPALSNIQKSKTLIY
eukprot:TRINITY_DN26199_c0_g1_i6.p2 TRINITY_DN26199_c0_g1~~TRINITY_DN26199_c0_g1_i6.p2  ORF type:complete len:149 (-),score=41.34 TRINITY_DN26199_c0_g1_i6:23-469(-)